MKTVPNPAFEAECNRILRGEKHLFHGLIRPRERSTYFQPFVLPCNQAEAEAAARETVIKVYRILQLFRGEFQFRTWILSIAQ